MTRNHLCCSAPVFLMLLGPWGALTTPCQRAEGCVCLHCPAGQEPSMACSELEVTDVTAECRDCPSDTFSDGHDPELCRPHTACETLNRQLLAAGTSHSDAACGACLPGFHSETTQKSSPLQACVTTPPKDPKHSAGVSAPLGSGVGVTNATAARSSENAEYAVYALAPVFCVMGLLGIFICNLLKKKGYTCTPEKEAAHNDTPQKDGNPFPCIVENSNEDTISVLVRLISEKTENAAALEEMLLEYELTQTDISKSPLLSPEPLKFQSLPRLCSHQHHLHTINGLVPHSGFCCSRCSQKKWPKLLLRPTPLFVDANKTAHTPVKPPSTNEGIVLSVGRFQVAQIQESKPVSISTTSTEGRDTDLVEPAEGMSFLGMASLSKAPSPHAADRT
ncbi:tumor necrosis factor receptor superfamily member 19L isoform X2 [Electrophorus electricus]|uniref:tumor necrosis factor receptor superfamily member 19L isoform X2 n=1 Tax=Electrophorus electricus TaxID=8005 RepID=UPI0015D0A032|nr:tumor necrosis factor receptor superfamily member 19L isoform X2 [Electrophorus electricus]